MTSTSIPSIAYIATQVCSIPSNNFLTYPVQVRFALTSATVFSRTDTVTDSERFYHSMLDILEDPSEGKEVANLLAWWDQ